jgi:tetratricopeptide (TPR) repeat protein
MIQQLKARDELNRGVTAFTAQRYDEAIEHFKVAVDADPELIAARLYLATAYRAQFIPQATSVENLEKARLAIETFQDVIDTAAEDKQSRATAMANLAGIYSGMGEYEKAKEWYRERTDLEPDNPDPLYGIGTINWQLVYDETGMTGENIENMEEEQLAEVNLLVDEGVDVLKKALELNPEYVDAMQYLNLLYREKAKLTEDEESKREWEREADNLALNALDMKRRQQQEAEEARRRLSPTTEE